MYVLTYLKHSTLNSVTQPELRGGGGGGGAQGQHNKFCLVGFCLCEALHSKGSDKISKKVTPARSGLINMSCHLSEILSLKDAGDEADEADC